MRSPLLQGADAERWQNLFLKHAAVYLEGSKAPDNTFKDFKNHVLHVRDDYWGGAPEKAQEWYGKLLEALRGAAWSEAVYAAGVLSHYYTDPIHPFHTAQTEAENAIHRACEWSINRSYDELAKLGRERFAAIEVAVPEGAQWLKEMVCHGAETSNRQYEKLIAHYDITRGVADPPSGLDQTGRVLVAELIAYASTGFARILERAFAESGVTPPEVSLTAEAFLATLQIPQKWIEKKLTNAEDRALVLSMYPRAAGDWPRRGDVAGGRPHGPRRCTPRRWPSRAPPRRPRSAPSAWPSRRSRGQQQRPKQNLLKSPCRRRTRRCREHFSRPPTISKRRRPSDRARRNGSARPAFSPSATSSPPIPTPWPRRSRSHGVGADTLRTWQQQAHLVMDVPGLRGTHAQLLTAAGYHDAAAVAAADPGDAVRRGAALCDVAGRPAHPAPGRSARGGEDQGLDQERGGAQGGLKR